MPKPPDIIPANPPPEQGKAPEAGANATSQAAKAKELKRLKRKKEAERVKNERRAKEKNPRPDGEPKSKAEVIQEKSPGFYEATPLLRICCFIFAEITI